MLIQWGRFSTPTSGYHDTLCTGGNIEPMQAVYRV